MEHYYHYYYYKYYYFVIITTTTNNVITITNIIITNIIIIVIFTLFFYSFVITVNFFLVRGPVRPEGSPFSRFLTLGCCDLKDEVSSIAQTYLYNSSMQPSLE